MNVAAPAEGVIRFHLDHRPGPPPKHPGLGELNALRSCLFELGLIGCDAQGVGYGNLSVRTQGNQFIVSASATGALPALTDAHFTLVEACDPARNRVQACGPLPASSESMTHGALYAARPDVHCVVHVHSPQLFAALLAAGAAHTAADIGYGTPEMAMAVATLVRQQPEVPGIFAMAGHADGVVAYGASVAQAGALLLAQWARCQRPPAAPLAHGRGA